MIWAHAPIIFNKSNFGSTKMFVFILAFSFSFFWANWDTVQGTIFDHVGEHATWAFIMYTTILLLFPFLLIEGPVSSSYLSLQKKKKGPWATAHNERARNRNIRFLMSKRKACLEKDVLHFMVQIKCFKNLNVESLQHHYNFKWCNTLYIVRSRK